MKGRLYSGRAAEGQRCVPPEPAERLAMRARQGYSAARMNEDWLAVLVGLSLVVLAAAGFVARVPW